MRDTARLWGFLAFILLIVVSFRQVILPFVLAILVTYVLAPVLNAMCRVQIAGRRLPRFLWLIGLYAGLLGLIVLFFTLFVPRVTQDFKRIMGEAPQLVQRVKQNYLPSLDAWIERNFHEQVKGTSQPVRPKRELPQVQIKRLPEGKLSLDLRNVRLEVKQLKDGHWMLRVPGEAAEDTGGSDARRYLESALTGSGVQMKTVLTAGQRVIGAALRAITTFILVFMISAFLLLDTDRILRFFGTLVPPQYLDDYHKMIALTDLGLSGAIRGQLIICLVNGVLTWIGLMVIGVKYSFLLALLAAVMSLIPIFGSILSSVPIVVVALVSGADGLDFLRGLMVLGWILGIHLVEANLLNPKIIGTAARIHPVVVIFAVVAGERTYGAVGALLGVPIVSAVQATFIYMRTKMRGEVEPAEPGPSAAGGAPPAG